MFFPELPNTRYFWCNASLHCCICFLNPFCHSSGFFLLPDTPLKKGTRTVFSEGFQEAEFEPAIKMWEFYSSKKSSLPPLTTTLSSHWPAFSSWNHTKFSVASGPLHMLLLKPTISFLSSSPPLQGQVLLIQLAEISLQRASLTIFLMYLTLNIYSSPCSFLS